MSRKIRQRHDESSQQTNKALLVGASLESADLRDADLAGAEIDGATFLASCLSRARFVDAFVDLDLSSPAATKRADFRFSEGRYVDFTNAKLAHADFQGAQLSDVKLRGANTSDVRWPQGWTSTGIPSTDVRPVASCASRNPG